MRVFVLILTALSASCSAFAWGCDGHQIVALIARAHLTPAASAAVDRLLRQHPIDPALNRFCKNSPADPMADSSTWADDVKNTEKTGEWHYVNIPLAATGPGSLEFWCPPLGPSVEGKDRPGCITNAIEYEWTILRDSVRPPAERATALRYLIHFVGDIHQPLHDEDNNDRGGNCATMTFFAEDRATNLHSIWDYRILQRELNGRKTTLAGLADALDRQYAKKAKSRGTETDPVAWAWDGNAVAKSVTYGALKPAIPVEYPNQQDDCDGESNKVAALHIVIGDAYFDRALPVVEEQLAKAGYRLAYLLNVTFL